MTLLYDLNSRERNRTAWKRSLEARYQSRLDIDFHSFAVVKKTYERVGYGEQYENTSLQSE